MCCYSCVYLRRGLDAIGRKLTTKITFQYMVIKARIQLRTTTNIRGRGHESYNPSAFLHRPRSFDCKRLCTRRLGFGRLSQEYTGRRFTIYAVSIGRGVPLKTLTVYQDAKSRLEDLLEQGLVTSLQEVPMDIYGELKSCANS